MATEEGVGSCAVAGSRMRVEVESGQGGCLGVLIKSAAIPNFSPVHNLINSDWNVPVPVLPPSAGPADFSFGLAPSKEARESSIQQVPCSTTLAFIFMSCTASCKL